MMHTFLDEAAHLVTTPAEDGSTIHLPRGTTSLDRSLFRKFQDRLPGPITYIDGGNASILSSANQLCHALRTASVSYVGARRTMTRLETSLVLGTANPEGITLRSIGLALELPALSLNDPHLRSGQHQVTLGSAIELSRSIAELTATAKSIYHLDEGSIICLDGDLTRNTHPTMTDLLRRTIKACDERGVTLIGLAKTITGTTNTGRGVTSALHRAGPHGVWGYPLEDLGGTHRAIAKLHPSASHCFLIESPAPISDEILGRLSSVSKDLSFPGYPYGLIIADQLARITNQERDSMAAILQAKAGAIDPSIPRSLAASNAHEILDRMQY